MRIAIFAEGLTIRGGIERMTSELANLLVNSHDVTLIVLKSCDRANTAYQLDSRIKFVSLNSNFSGLNINNIMRLRKELKQIDPVTLITVATPLVRISAPAVCGLNIRNIGWEHFNLYAGSKIGSCWKVLSTYFVNKTVLLTNIDEANYRRYHAINTVVVPNFSTICTNTPSECNDKIFLTVGRHSHEKGFDMLIRAWAKTDRKDWKLKIVGSGALKDRNVALANELNVSDSIIFIEATSDIVSEYQSASCYVLPSRYEGLVMVLIEARMMGLTCVSFDCPNSPREIIRDNIDGFLVPAEDVDALAAKLSEVLVSDDLRKYGAAAREDAMQRYGAEAASRMWEEILDPTKK